ncbi:MAG: LCP family protein [Clostridia bacterium]|nr:LCP family protein [Clostridia bacterium]
MDNKENLDNINNVDDAENLSGNDNIEFDFNDTFENIISSSKNSKDGEFEDIVSDSSLKHGKHIYEDISSSSRKKNKKIQGWQKALIITGTSLFLVITLAVVWFLNYFDYNYREITNDPNALGFVEHKDEEIINIALFGVDSRDEYAFKGNTDSIMILSLNARTKKVKIISVMRDTFVPMEYQGKNYYAKINSAYSKGPEHAIKTLNQVYDLDISEYATVNFFGMTDIIDAVGGITATITKDEITWKGNDHPNLNNCMDEICRELGLNAKDYYIHTAGEQTLNGVQAVAYARVRHCTSAWGTRDDFGRTDRQRHVMQELFNKATKMGTSQYISLAKALIPCTETSLSYGDIIDLATGILMDSPEFEQYRLPPAEYQTKFLMKGPTGYGSIIYYDLDYAAKLVNGIIYDDLTIDEFVEQNPIEKNDWYYDMTGTHGKDTTTSSATSSSTSSVISSSDTTSTEEEDTSSDDVTSEDEAPDEDVSSEDETPSEDTSSEETSSEEGTESDVTDGDVSSDVETEETPSTPEETTSSAPGKKPHRSK